ncbi:MAG: DinB family protein [Candidatus Rokubacteria bacterium]|nr:DinB family protein [Candidatus Rokubacteria bacterium]
MPLDKLERDRLIQQYANGPSRLKAALAQVPWEAQKWRPVPGEWSAHEVVCHCADSETNAAARIRFLVVEKEPVVPGYDQDAWAVQLDYHSHPLDLVLATVDAVRANTAALLRRLPDDAWAKVGHHTESGRYTAEDWLKIYAEHLEVHARQIETNLAAWRATLPGGAGR